MAENAQLEEMAKEARRQYSREWRRKNKDRIREINARYWRRRAERMAERKEAVPDGG